MPTIKELYDQGQRQFPMRGGGISPMVEWWDCALQYMPIYGGHILCWQENGEFLDSQGNYIDPMDLLPEPLPNQSDKERIATLEAAVLEAVKVIEELSDCVQDGLPTRLQDAARLKAIAGGQDNERG